MWYLFLIGGTSTTYEDFFKDDDDDDGPALNTPPITCPSTPMASSPGEEARGVSSTALDTSSNGLKEYIEQTAAQEIQPITVTISQL